jgi:hypothetical protein
LSTAPPIKQWKWLWIALIAVSVGLAYTVLSEWMNTAAKKWLILPPPALVLARLLARQP